MVCVDQMSDHGNCIIGTRGIVEGIALERLSTSRNEMVEEVGVPISCGCIEYCDNIVAIYFVSPFQRSVATAVNIEALVQQPVEYFPPVNNVSKMYQMS